MDFEKEYLMHTERYVIERGFNHYQFIDLIHNPVKGNIGGMIFYWKYAGFKGRKDEKYVRYAIEYARQVCDELNFAGIKSYIWHHELELPVGFEAVKLSNQRFKKVKRRWSVKILSIEKSL